MYVGRALLFSIYQTRFPNVLHVPKLTKNVLLINQLIKQNDGI
jgi:hypothetical protein